jgi:hypothetical protein
MPSSRILTSLVVLAAALVALPANATDVPAASAATPTPPASTKPLREIGHVRALTTYCRTTIDDANATIETALDNDARIALTINRLRTIDLDSTIIKKAQGTRDLTAAFVAVRAAAVRGEGQAKRLRADAENAPNETQKGEMTALANALGGAAFRQKKLADEMGSYIAYLDAHPPITQFDRDQQQFDLQYAQSFFGTPIIGDSRDYLTPTLGELAKGAADQFVDRTATIAADEGTAAAHVEPAFSGC